MASISFQATDFDSGTIGTSGVYTFPLTVASAAGQERLIAFGAICGPITTPAVTSITVDGQTATQIGSVVRGANDGTNAQSFVGFWRAPGTSGTTINVVVTKNVTGSFFGGFCALWTLTDADTVLDTGGAGTDDPVLSLDTVAGGVAAGAGIGYSGTTPSATWSGLTERFDSVTAFGDDVFTGADLNVVSGSTPLTVQITFTAFGGTLSVCGMSVSFNPEAAAGTPTPGPLFAVVSGAGATRSITVPY